MKFNTKRKKQYREPYDRVLITCEGETEQIYFQGLINDLKLSVVNVNLINPSATDPNSLLKIAQDKSEYAKRQGNSYDRVYCMFDKDQHLKYKDTKNNIQQKKSFYVAFSEPCFEFWLLLHFYRTTKPFIECDALQKDKLFKRHLPNYNKTDKDLFKNLTSKQIKTACKNSFDNPLTNVNELVEYLQQIKNI
jgi:hypothetical protein